jgi:hypothetical protein
VSKLDVVLEVGKKRVFASALDWPGWARIGCNEADAIEALLAYEPRYRRVIAHDRLGFETASGVRVVERLDGNATTDYGAPDKPASLESEPVDAEDLERLLTILSASWDALQRAVEAADGKELQKGPRGGGRTVGGMVEHVLNAHHSYQRQIFWREKQPRGDDVARLIEAMKQADAEAMAFAVSEEMPQKGPRGNALWAPRYFVRRAAWHILDHAWEIEDKVIG